jgi:hypothetical protein
MSLFELRSDAPRSAAGNRRRPAKASTTQGSRRARGETPWWTLVTITVAAACGLAALTGHALVNGDGAFHLIWGRELADGTLTTFSGGPTPHPSLLVLAGGTSLLGDEASYMLNYVLLGPIAFGVLVAAVFEIARRLSSSAAAAVAALLVAASPGMLANAGTARYDIAFAALVMIAVALEMARPRRGLAPLVCLALAGLVRPEAWLIAGLYWLWLARSMRWRERALTAALVALAPALWTLMDAVVMGDPLYSLHVTDTASEVLYRQYSAWQNLGQSGKDLVWYVGFVPLLALPATAVLMVRDRARAALPLLGVLGITVGTFLLFLANGMASNERYLLTPACVVAILTAIAIDGDGLRTPRRVAVGVFLAVFLAFQLAIRTDSYSRLRSDAATVHSQNVNARALVDLPGVRNALRRCPTVALAGNKMRHRFAFHSGRAPEALPSDGHGLTHPDLYIAPANPEAAKAVLTRPRFDDDASFRVPAGLRRGPANADWVLYVAPSSACARGLL